MGHRPENDEAITYASYLRVGELLKLQHFRSADPVSGQPEDDELLFIVIHQVYELWFKELLHELDRTVSLLREGSDERAGHVLKRVLKILKTLVTQVDILETMTPAGFASFRSFLASASGFQSAQFREIEFALGMKERARIERFEGEERVRLEARLEAPTLWDAFVHKMHRDGMPVPAEVLARDVRQPIVECPELQRVIVDHFGDAGFANLIETLTDLDEGLQEWRYRHLMMARRTIGTRRGTGGSDGSRYLAGTLFRPAFPDLWAIRSAF